MPANKKILGDWVFDSDDVCLIDGDNHYSYRDVGNLCSIYYNEWFNFNRRNLILLDCDDSFHSYIFAIGARIFNATLILASKDTTKNNIVSIIKKFTPSYFISSRLADISMDGYSSKKYLNHYIYSKESSDLLMHPDLSILFTTSGTTGSLKLCKVSNQNLRTSALQIIDSLSVTKSDRAITTLPLSYVYGFSILNSHLAAGSSLVINNASILTDVFWEVSRKYSVTNLNAVPFQFRMLKRIYRDHFSRNNNLRYVTQAGGPLDSDTALFIYSKSRLHNFRFYMMYGQTEASSRIGCNYIARKEDIGFVGKIVAGGDLLGWENFQPNLQYELIYRGQNVFMGYANSLEDLKSDDLPSRVLHTGDIVLIDGSMGMKIVSRKNRITKINGIRVMLDELENLLLSYGVDSACISNEDDLIVIYYESEEEIDLISIIQNNTTINRRYIKLIRIDRLPRNIRGKIDYNMLKTNHE